MNELLSRVALAGALFGGTLCLAACTATPLGALPANQSKANALPGAEVYKRSCANCHGPIGEGLASVPPLMGTGALPVYARDPSTTSNPALQDLQEQERKQNLPPGAETRRPFKSAQDLFDYVSKTMPLPRSKAGSLPKEEYWAVLNYLLVGHGVAVPPEGVNESNASNVSIKPAQ